MPKDCELELVGRSGFLSVNDTADMFTGWVCETEPIMYFLEIQRLGAACMHGSVPSAVFYFIFFAFGAW